MSGSVTRRPGWGTYARDTVLFGFGIALVMKQAGMWFEPPASGPSVLLVSVGALFCNGPLIIQALTAWRAGTGSPQLPSAPSASPSPSEPSSEVSP